MDYSIFIAIFAMDYSIFMEGNFLNSFLGLEFQGAMPKILHRNQFSFLHIPPGPGGLVLTGMTSRKLVLTPQVRFSPRLSLEMFLAHLQRITLLYPAMDKKWNRSLAQYSFLV